MQILRGLLPAALLLTAVPARADDCKSDAADRQGVGTFSQLLDGQPATPGQPQLTLTGSDGTGDQNYGAAISLTPAKSAFWCDMLVTVTTPGITAVGDRAVVDRSFDLSWEQRWRADDAHGPSLATFVDVEIPVDSPGEVAQFTFTGVVARTVRRGETFYFNLTVQSDDGRTVKDWGVGALVGWRHDLKGGSSLVLDAGIEPGGTRVAELAWQANLSSRLAIGPGISLSHSNGHTDATFGLTLARVLGPAGN